MIYLCNHYIYYKLLFNYNSDLIKLYYEPNIIPTLLIFSSLNLSIFSGLSLDVSYCYPGIILSSGDVKGASSKIF